MIFNFVFITICIIFLSQATSTVAVDDDGEVTTFHPFTLPNELDEEVNDFPDLFTTTDSGTAAVEILEADLKLEDLDAYAVKSCKCGKAGASASSPLEFNRNSYSESEGLPIEPLVIGGAPAGLEEFPWMVGLSKKRLYDNQGSHKIVCGGSLINNKYVLTAAHCIDNQFTSRFELLFRAYNISNKNDPKVLMIKAKRFISHPGWNSKTVANDIGIIELATPINFATDKVVPVCLPTKSDGDFANQNATVTGWGYTHSKGSMATILQKVTVPVISHSKCTKTRYGNIVTPTMLCAGLPEGGKDACTNDSGGPLTVVQNGSHKLIGIVSWGHGCAQPLLPGVFTRVTKYLEWIDSVVGRAQSCRT